MNPFTFPVTENEPMLRHTTLRVGGPAQYFFIAKTSEDAARAAREALGKKISYAVLGGGSNTLVSDAGFNGLIIKIAGMKVSVQETVSTAEAGTPSVMFARGVASHDLAGLEWMVTLPGTVGGAVYGNAGAYGSETRDRIVSVLVLAPDGEIQTMTKAECRFGYRDSVFKHADPRLMIMSASFKLDPGEPLVIQSRMHELLTKRLSEQPLGTSSAGCLFKNVEVRPDQVADLLARLPGDGHEFVRRGRIPAGWLMQKAGLKNFTVGHAQVSDRHANFCLNTGGATAADIRSLAIEAQERVGALFGLHLELEVQFLGF